MIRQVEVPAAVAGSRADRALAELLAVPRNQVQQWLAAGRVRRGDRPISRPSEPLVGGEILTVDVPTVDHAATIAAEPGELALLHVDDDLLVLDKPAGLIVHPGAGRATGTLVHRLIAAFPELALVGGPGRPGIVHRLDRDTSGVMVVARRALAYQILTRSFASRQVEKTYLALVWGTPRPASGDIELAIGRHPTRRTAMAVRHDGRPAHTSYATAASAGGVALLVLRLATGRTHQIRVHLRAVGHPLLGDPVYGEERWKGLPRARQAAARAVARPALHSWRLAFAHPSGGEPIASEAPPPADLVEAWLALTDQPWPESGLTTAVGELARLARAKARPRSRIRGSLDTASKVS